MILGLPTGRRPMEGHQIRRADELANSGAPGSIPGEARHTGPRKPSGEALVRTVREEHAGPRPGRTLCETAAKKADWSWQSSALPPFMSSSAPPTHAAVPLFAAGADGAGA